MSEWEPKRFTDDPIANAIMNVAASISDLSEATNGLLYGLKFSKREGMSIAESLEVGAKKIADEVANLASAVSSQTDE